MLVGGQIFVDHYWGATATITALVCVENLDRQANQPDAQGTDAASGKRASTMWCRDKYHSFDDWIPQEKATPV